MSKILGVFLIIGVLSSFMFVGRLNTNERNIELVKNTVETTELIKVKEANTIARLKTEDEKYNDWFNSQFSSYDGSLIGINTLIKGKMDNPDPFKYIKTSSVEFSKVPEAMKTFNKIAQHYRAPEATSKDFLLYVDFRGENKLKETVKQRALFICYYKNEKTRPEVSLLEIEE